MRPRIRWLAWLAEAGPLAHALLRGRVLCGARVPAMAWGAAPGVARCPVCIGLAAPAAMGTPVESGAAARVDEAAAHAAQTRVAPLAEGQADPLDLPPSRRGARVLPRVRVGRAGPPTRDLLQRAVAEFEGRGGVIRKGPSMADPAPGPRAVGFSPGAHRH